MHVKPHHQQRQHVGQAVAHHGTAGYADDRTHTASTPAIRAASDETADRSALVDHGSRRTGRHARHSLWCHGDGGLTTRQ